MGAWARVAWDVWAQGTAAVREASMDPIVALREFYRDPQGDDGAWGVRDVYSTCAPLAAVLAHASPHVRERVGVLQCLNDTLFDTLVVQRRGVEELLAALRAWGERGAVVASVVARELRVVARWPAAHAERVHVLVRDVVRVCGDGGALHALVAPHGALATWEQLDELAHVFGAWVGAAAHMVGELEPRTRVGRGALVDAALGDMGALLVKSRCVALALWPGAVEAIYARDQAIRLERRVVAAACMSGLVGDALTHLRAAMACLDEWCEASTMWRALATLVVHVLHRVAAAVEGDGERKAERALPLTAQQHTCSMHALLHHVLDQLLEVDGVLSCSIAVRTTHADQCAHVIQYLVKALHAKLATVPAPVVSRVGTGVVIAAGMAVVLGSVLWGRRRPRQRARVLRA